MSSAAYRIFHTPWLVSVPDMYCYSEAHISDIGFITTGDKNADLAIRNAPRDMYLTIVAMVSYYEEGASIRFKDPKDIRTIYSLIMEHLNNWAAILKSTISSEAPPLDDFVRLDNFAAALFPLTSVNYGTEIAYGLSRRLLLVKRGLSGLGGRLKTKRVLPVSPDEVAPLDLTTPGHVSPIGELAYHLLKEDDYI